MGKLHILTNSGTNRCGRRLTSHAGNGSRTGDLVGELARTDFISSNVTGAYDDNAEQLYVYVLLAAPHWPSHDSDLFIEMSRNSPGVNGAENDWPLGCSNELDVRHTSHLLFLHLSSVDVE